MLTESNSETPARKRVFGVLRNFARNENGLVSVEWVALAGAVLIGAIAVGWIVLNGLTSPANSIGNNLASCESIAASNSGNTSGCK